MKLFPLIQFLWRHIGNYCIKIFCVQNFKLSKSSIYYLIDTLKNCVTSGTLMLIICSKKCYLNYQCIVLSVNYNCFFKIIVLHFLATLSVLLDNLEFKNISMFVPSVLFATSHVYLISSTTLLSFWTTHTTHRAPIKQISFRTKRNISTPKIRRYFNFMRN